jgi:hypothetical protein
MSSGELHRALARATGESVRTIKRFGFSLWDPPAADFDDEALSAEPQVVDWDALEAERNALAIQA